VAKQFGMGDLQNAMGCAGMDRTEGQGMSYDKLVAALRCKRDDCEGCDLAFFDKDEGWMCQYAAKDDDAADAIEELNKNWKYCSDMLNLALKVSGFPMTALVKLYETEVQE
jgi:hypothetical protein